MSESSDHAREPLPPTATMRDIFDYCKKHKLYSLAQGMIELPPPEILREILAVIVAGSSVHQYRARAGEDDFRRAIAHHLTGEWNATAITPENILATQGVSGAIVTSLLYARHKGVTRVGIIQPFYTYHMMQIVRLNFEQQSQIQSVYNVHAETPIEEKSWGSVKGACAFIKGKKRTIAGVDVEIDLDWETLEAALNDGIGALIVCNPGNPYGRVWTEDDLERLVSLCQKAGALLILDECYADLTFGGARHVCPLHKAIRDNVIVARGFSKVLGVQSWRVGYAMSSERVIKECTALHDPIYLSVPITQHAIATYFEQDAASYAEHREELKTLMWANWEILSTAFEAAFGWTPLPPEGSMYGCFVHHEQDDMTAVKKALARGVGICPGGIFYGGNPSHTGLVRIHLGINLQKSEAIGQRILTSE